MDDRGVAAALEAAKRFGETESLDVDNGGRAAHVLIVPEGRKIHSIKPLLDEYLTKPERRKGTATLTTLASFVDHVNRHKDEHSVVFAHVTEPEAQLLAVFDYNESGAAGDEGGARFGQHRAVYGCPFSDEWKAWTMKRGEMSLADFATYLEDRIMDVLPPASAGETIKAFADQLSVQLASPQRLMELSRGLTVNVGQKVVNHVNLSTGEGTVSFEERHTGEGGDSVKVPGAFALAIPVFKGGDAYQIPVRLRYRTAGGQVTWSFTPQRIDRVRDHAINEACDVVKKETGLALFFGRPEA